MTKGFILIDETGSFEKMAFSIDKSVAVGTTSGWSGDHSKALRFARKEDAESFAKVYLPSITGIGAKEYEGK